MLRTIDLNSLDGGTLERGQKNATKGVTQRIAVATLERLDGDTSRRLVDLFDLNLSLMNSDMYYLQPQQPGWTT